MTQDDAREQEITALCTNILDDVTSSHLELSSDDQLRVLERVRDALLRTFGFRDAVEHFGLDE